MGVRGRGYRDGLNLLNCIVSLTRDLVCLVTLAIVPERANRKEPNNFLFADEPLAIRKRYGVTEEISLSFLRAPQAAGLLV